MSNRQLSCRDDSADDGRFLRSSSLDAGHGRHCRVAGIAGRNRFEIIRVVTKTLLPFDVHPLLLFDPLQFLAEFAVGSDSIAVADKRERNDRDT